MLRNPLREGVRARLETRPGRVHLARRCCLSRTLPVFARSSESESTPLQGERYEGGVADGKYHGRGRLINTLGAVIEGNWIHGQLE